MYQNVYLGPLKAIHLIINYESFIGPPFTNVFLHALARTVC